MISLKIIIWQHFCKVCKPSLLSKESFGALQRFITISYIRDILHERNFTDYYSHLNTQHCSKE